MRTMRPWERAVGEYLVACKGGKKQVRPAVEVANEIWRQMSEDFPADAIEWIYQYPCKGPLEVPVSSIDYKNARQWMAWKEPDRVGFFERKLVDGEAVKPLILVQRPKHDDLMIVDGHHRGLAYKRQELTKALAYVIKVNATEGPWDETHDSQRERRSG